MSGGRVAFGPFQFDADSGLLWREGALVHLRPQPLAALRALLARPGDVVSREALVRAVWGDGRHVDFNAGLNFCIAQLRDALDDPAQTSAYIVAVPRRGYRFAAAVAPVTSVAPTVDDAPPSRARWPLGAVAAIAVIVALAALVVAMDARGIDGPRWSPAAVKAVVRGSTGLDDAGPTELVDRLARFDEALQLAPEYPDAWAGRAVTLLLLGEYRQRTPAAAYAEALADARHALALAPRHADAEAAAGWATLLVERNWTDARRHLDAAVALAPQSARPRVWRSRLLSGLGLHDAAIADAERAVAAAPASPTPLVALGRAAFFAGQLDRAMRACDDATRLIGAFSPGWICGAAAAAERGDTAGASSRLRRATTAPAPGVEPGAFWQTRLATLEPVIAAGCACDEPLLAGPLAHLGQADRALAVLERGVDRMSDRVLWMAVDPALASLRDTDRFRALLRRAGLTAAF